MADVLVLVAPDPPPEPGIGRETVLLGLTLEQRLEKAARRAGFEEILLEGETKRDPGGDAVRLAWNAVATVEDLRALRARTRKIFLEGNKTDAPAAGMAGSAAPAQSASGTFEEKTASRPAGPLFVRSVGDLRKAEKYLLQSLVKSTEPFMSRHFERKVSLALTRHLVRTSVTPNAMTLISVGIGLLGSFFFVSSRPLLQLSGALLFLLHSILDGCDGEIARLKFLESRWGGLLDFWGDNVVHSAVFACLAVGWSRSAASPWPLGLGALAIAGTLASAGFVYHSTMRSAASPAAPLFTTVTKGPSTPLTRAVNALGGRDFIYLVVALAAFGQARWFLAAAAAGAPLFFLTLLLLARGGRVAERVPA